MKKIIFTFIACTLFSAMTWAACPQRAETTSNRTTFTEEWLEALFSGVSLLTEDPKYHTYNDPTEALNAAMYDNLVMEYNCTDKSLAKKMTDDAIEILTGS